MICATRSHAWGAKPDVLGGDSSHHSVEVGDHLRRRPIIGGIIRPDMEQDQIGTGGGNPSGQAVENSFAPRFFTNASGLDEPTAVPFMVCGSGDHEFLARKRTVAADEGETVAESAAFDKGGFDTRLRG